MKEKETHKCYTGNTGGYNPKKSQSIIKGEYFSFEIQIKRKNGQIFLKEISNGKTSFSRISESVKDDTKTNIILLKSRLMSHIFEELERGFDRLENPIGTRIKIKESTNDSQLKKSA